jgi:hypothetical protein
MNEIGGISDAGNEYEDPPVVAPGEALLLAYEGANLVGLQNAAREVDENYDTIVRVEPPPSGIVRVEPRESSRRLMGRRMSRTTAPTLGYLDWRIHRIRPKRLIGRDPPQARVRHPMPRRSNRPSRMRLSRSLHLSAAQPLP